MSNGVGLAQIGRTNRRDHGWYVFLAAILWTWVASGEANGVTFTEALGELGGLETIAGTALIEQDTVNGWLPEMEGGLAIDAELSRPHMAMADWRGNVYVADKDGHAIRQITPDGRIHTIAGINEAGFNGDGVATESALSQPNGLYTFPNGTTYIVDSGNHMIRRLSVDGQLTTILEDPLGIPVGRGLWVSPDESTLFYTAGTEVKRWTATAGIEVYASGFAELGNIAVDPADGRLVVTDRGAHGVYKLDERGSRELIAGDESTGGGGSGQLAVRTGLEEVRGVYFHPHGGYFLATHKGGQVWFVDDAARIYLLIDGDDKGTHSGDGLPISSPGRKISEPRAVTLAPNGDLLVTEHDGGYIRVARAKNPWQIGDFDQDRDRDEHDINALAVAMRSGRNPQDRDLNFDGRVNELDRDVWVTELRRTYNGDSNLDGEFNSQDFVQIFQRGEYEDSEPFNSEWGDGDWDGSGDFDSRDFVVAFQGGGYETGPRAAAAVIPEPSTHGLLLTAVSLGWLARRRCQ